MDPQRDERLLHAVMEVTLDLPPLGRRRCHEPPLRRAQRADGVEQVLLEAPVLENQQCGGAHRADELRILAEDGLVEDGEGLALAVTERTPRLPLLRRLQDDRAAVAVDEALAPRQPEREPRQRIVEHLPHELLDGGGRRSPDQPTCHERERLSGVRTGEEQRDDESQWEDDARADEDGPAGRANRQDPTSPEATAWYVKTATNGTASAKAGASSRRRG